MKPNEIIKKKRLDKKLSAKQVAEACGLTISEYEDLEDYEDEILTAISLGKVKRVCSCLDTEVRFLLNLKEWRDELPSSQSFSIKAARIKEGLNETELGDRIGIHDWSIKEVEADPACLDGWLLIDILSLAKTLEILPDVLISKSSKGDKQ